MEISKELIEKALRRNIVSFTINSGFIFIQEKSISHNLNTYEFAFKCKEWAFENGYIIEIGVHPIIKQDRNDRDYFYTIKSLSGELLKISNIDNIFKSETTATFKACEWILDNEKNPK